MDIQLLLVLILALLAISLTSVCVYIIVVLKEFRETIRRANHLLEKAHSATDIFINPAATIVGIASTVVEAIKAVKSIRTIAEYHNNEEE